ncbi:MAG: metallophosphoesterase family protein, partial [Bryobacterales bacterium]|nr:metallophosphoesterase family protein [Bryobacterales bacterium]
MIATAARSKLFAVAVLSFCLMAAAQDARPTREGQPPNVGVAAEPYTVYDTRPVILHGPYILAPTETSATIAWATDTPCHSKVLYGIDETDTEAINQKDGMLPVGTFHAVHVTGLKPGQTYKFRAVSTRVVKLKGYWPEKGLSIMSPVSTFTTFDRARPSTTFYAITDTHEDAARIDALMKLADWKSADFLIHLGDSVNTAESEDQIFSKFLDPIAKGMGPAMPLLYARGNHETRGPFAREFRTYMPIEEGRLYYARDIGPVHAVVLDTGEDKPDNTNVYAQLNAFAPYRKQELAWLEAHTRESRRMAEAPFRILMLHQPRMGYVGNETDKWTDWANRSGFDLGIGGHHHRFSVIEPSEGRNHFPILVLGQDQLAKVEV